MKHRVDVVAAGGLPSACGDPAMSDQSVPTMSNEALQPTVQDAGEESEDIGSLTHDIQAIEASSDSHDKTIALSAERTSLFDDATSDIKRWPSLRTEALIHAAAKDIVAHVATRPRASLDAAVNPSSGQDRTMDEPASHQSPRESFDQRSDAFLSQTLTEADTRHAICSKEFGDDSSHHGHDDEVFSDNSPRSSMGSMPEAEYSKISSQRARSLRNSDVSQPKRDDDIVAKLHGTPRSPFRSPSSVQAIQMSSPPASVIGSFRSSRRTPKPSFSRLASPSLSAQYSPKKTPPRFKRNTPPLVLLHVTLMPSRWAWSYVLENTHPTELSPECKILQESWRQLRDRIGDTVSDRGVLLPHPQNDYEVLEERLLEALELPLRRRARILECGHYLGPSNEMFLADEIASEDGEYADERRSLSDKLPQRKHWCGSCLSEIEYESLGAGKVYRVKVYASNGLMRAGAWEACWREMERVDVELEPIVDAKLQEELAALASDQERVLAMEEEQAAAAAAAAVDEELARREAEEAEAAAEEDIEASRSFIAAHADNSLACGTPVESGSPSYDDGRRLRDEERLREVYGHSTPVREARSSTLPSRHSDFIPVQRPLSPSAEASEKREERRRKQRNANRSASLAELILEASRILMQDQKNIIIGLLALLVLVLALQSGNLRDVHSESAVTSKTSVPQAQLGKRFEAASQELIDTPTESAWGTMALELQPTILGTADPCEACAKHVEEAATLQLNSTSLATVTVVSTVTNEVSRIVTQTVISTGTAEAVPQQSTLRQEVDVQITGGADKRSEKMLNG